ncbi:MAG TPA: glycosyltransferase [Aggregatilinea sp.]|uniref:glycosyltransferase n=1 Tax=Aggregatilinea sp. TaxID=2806333 RepID=UPI002C89A4D3|nr:glycosyltransferase [Aggregatilinea sp.]HML22763.1 glycosyltransferase [Aggregatilinea sp.]
MKILMLSKALVVGAYQRKLEEMARLPDVDLRVLVPPSWKDPRGDLRLERAHVEGYDLRVTPIRLNGNFHLHTYPRLGAEIRDFRPDVVHIDEEPYNAATWQALWHARRAGAKTLFFSWQNIARRYPPPFSWGERWVLRHVDRAIMGTQSAADVWRAKGYTGALTVIPQFGVDPVLFSPPEMPRSGEEPFTVGFAGRLVEEKGGADLLDALTQLPVPWRLRIAGDGPEKDALIAQAGRLGAADRLSFVALPSTEMPTYYRGLDALVIPSLTRPNWKEQFGRVIVEAMACGVPVVGSDSGAIPDVIGDAGRIVPEGDVAALAAALRDLAVSPELRRDLGARGRDRVLGQFTQAQVAVQTVEVYRALVC